MPDGSKPRENENGRIIKEDSDILRRSILTNGSGRIWKAECITTSICDIDWDIYKQAYEWEKFEVLKMEYAERGDLPDYIKLTAIKLYEKKAALKKAGKTHCAEYYTAKTLVSNVFGAIVKKIDKAKAEGDEKTWYACTLDSELKAQWGVYITAYARKVLCDLILQLGHDWLYSDTDSVYFKKTERTVQLLNIYNIDMKMKNYNMCKKYGLDYELFDDLGCFDSEDIHIKRFKTIGAKAYLYITDKDEFKLVLAGIPEQFFWKAYTDKYNKVALKDKEKEINRIFDFFEKDTPIVYTRRKMVYVKDTDDIINGMKVHCDTGCIIKEDDIVGTIGTVQDRVAAEQTFSSLQDERK